MPTAAAAARRERDRHASEQGGAAREITARPQRRDLGSWCAIRPGLTSEPGLSKASAWQPAPRSSILWRAPQPRCSEPAGGGLAVKIRIPFTSNQIAPRPGKESVAAKIRPWLCDAPLARERGLSMLSKTGEVVGE